MMDGTEKEKDDDLEKQIALPAVEQLDIEHVLVTDDPRGWSVHRKNVILIMVSAASMVAGLATNIQNPANKDIEVKLHASPSEISWSLSLFVLVQGNVPLMWAAIGEIKGRKIVYLVSFAILVTGSIGVATAQSIGLVIGMRALQGVGTSAVFAIGAGTLADIYEPAVRGSKIGVYYSAPMTAPSLGSVLGGLLTQAFGWRAVFWFLVIFSSCNFLSFLFLKDPFRKQRSLAYQTILTKRTKNRELSKVEGTDSTSIHTIDNTSRPNALEAPHVDEITLSLMDINPFPPILRVLQRRNNIAILFASGLLFAFSFSITYSCSRTMSDKYHYDALNTGLVLLAFGIGSISGSTLGGCWSDRTLSRLKAKNGGKSHPEMRLEATKFAMLFLPPSVLGYGWICEKKVHISGVCVMLFLVGFFSVWIYSSTLAYIVDANVGRSSTAVATNSSFRGIGAFVAAEIAVPLQNSIGDGGLFTMWAGLMVLTELLILLVLHKGGKWREAGEAKEAQDK